jgi:hypothetical protein
MLISATPALAATLTVNAGGNLQAAIDAAQPGDTIVLQAGATFDGPFTLRAKGGTDYITIRSSTPDASLPLDGTRITPAAASLLAKIRATQYGPALRTAKSASYWRLLFLEFLPASSNSAASLIDFGGDRTTQTSLADVPHHLVIDRVYLHGNPSYGQRRGVGLHSGETQILNSHFSDFKMVQQDTQAIGGSNGPGPYLIENNFIEAGAENILFGGSDPGILNLVPSNITIRRNLISKPMAWKTESWTVKNLIELKNAQGVLLDGNVFENVWAAGQAGYAIVISPRNQNGGAPWTVVQNITIQNNIFRHVGGVININGYDDLRPSQQTRNVVIRNNLAYDVSTAQARSGMVAQGRFAMIGNGPGAITIDHNTVDNNGSSTIYLFTGVSPDGPPIDNFHITNNLLRDNRYGLYGEGYGKGTACFNAYMPGGTLLRNTFAGGGASSYPTGNDFPTLAEWLGDFVNRAAGDYRLTSSSVSRHAATDGTDIGVNFTTLNAALAGAAPPPPPPPAPEEPSGSSAPYSGTAIFLPGTIQSEQYDRGGEGVAYHDTTGGNSGGVFRTDGVDLQVANDSGGGYKIKSAVAGEWLNYSVNVAAAGTYTLTIRVASGGTGGNFHVEVDGVDKTGTIAVPNTGGWQSWQTLTRTGVQLAAGPQVLRLVLDSNGPSTMTGNFNWIGVEAAASESESTPYSGTPIPLPGRIQAEDYDGGGQGVAYYDTTSGNSGGVYRNNHVDLQDAVDTGGGYKIKSAVAGEWLNYTVNVQTAGTYTISVRVASGGTGGTFHLEVDGVDRTGPMTVPNSGGWQVWRTVTKTGIALAAGEQVFRLVLDTNGGTGLTGNFNWLAVD